VHDKKNTKIIMIGDLSEKILLIPYKKEHLKNKIKTRENCTVGPCGMS
jgi:hypothetical protein